MARRQPRPRDRRGGTGSGAFFLVGCLVVLVLTFMLGMLVGRQWARSAALSPPALAAGADGATGTQSGRGESPAARPRARKLSEREPDDATPQIQDKLTFYKTLTAPLTAGPPPAPKRPPTEAARTDTERGSRREPATGYDPVDEETYTVQVAAFKTRTQADQLRETLGQEAYVSEGGSASMVRFRVRIGAFAARADAEEAAARLRAERALTGFVTRR